PLAGSTPSPASQANLSVRPPHRSSINPQDARTATLNRVFGQGPLASILAQCFAQVWIPNQSLDAHRKLDRIIRFAQETTNAIFNNFIHAAAAYADDWQGRSHCFDNYTSK